MLYDVERNLEHLKKAMDAYRNFIINVPHAKQNATAKKHLGDLDVELAKRMKETEGQPRPSALKGYDSSPAPTAAPTAVAAKAPEKQPVYKKWWPWTTVGGVAAVSLAVGLGVGLGTRWPQVDGCVGPGSPGMCPQP
jgi:hypothetical protein